MGRGDARLRALGIGVALAVALAGCAVTAIVPPARVTEPVTAALLDHGRHSSLLLERPDGSMLRYSYGEWEWYALGRTGAARALGALFWPTRAALGRKRLAGPLTAGTARAQVGEGFEDVLLFQVEAARAEQLVRRLDAVFAANRAKAVFHPGFDLEFVPLPDSYWLGRNSNQVMAQWLEELGVRVENPGALSAWRIAGEPVGGTRVLCTDSLIWWAVSPDGRFRGPEPSVWSGPLAHRRPHALEDRS